MAETQDQIEHRNHHIVGALSNDTIQGFFGDDTLEGRDGNDRLEGGDGNDAILGGDGNDKLIGGRGLDFLNGGDGNDVATYNDSDEAVTIDLGSGRGSGGTAEGDTLVSIEGIRGSDFDDTIIGNREANTLIGEDGNDSLFGSSGNDTLFDFGDGDDLLDGGSGRDLIIASSGNNTIVGGEGNDNLLGGTGSDTFVYELGDGGDQISNFDTSMDFLELSGIAHSPQAILDLLTVDGNNIILDLTDLRGSQEGDIITFNDVNIDDFHADLFVTETSSETTSPTDNDMPSEAIYEEEIRTIEQTASGLKYSSIAIENTDYHTYEIIDYNSF